MLSAVAFLTVVGGARPPGATTMRWFPVVGAALGGVLGGTWWAARELFPPGVAAVAVRCELGAEPGVRSAREVTVITLGELTDLTRLLARGAAS